MNRLWRIPIHHALWLALPLQLIVVWTAHRGWIQYARNADYRDSPKRSVPFDVDQWCYFTSRQLERSLARTLASRVPVGSSLQTISLWLAREDLALLNADLPASGKAKSYPAELAIGDQTHAVKARFMGDNHWHWLYPQKSWKVRANKRDPIENRRAFNIKNPTTRLALEDSLANQIGQEIGLLAPTVRPVKLFTNGVYAGVHLRWDLVDESLLRRNRRMPGSIYSGDGAPKGADGVGRLFDDDKYWKKDGARNSEQAEARDDIEMLIRVVRDADALQFSWFADRYLDLAQYAKFVALDRLVGGQHHDYVHNHKLYFDPYKGRFEPVVWDVSYWRLNQRPQAFDQGLNPLLNRVREHPEYELVIQRALYELLDGYPPELLQRRVEAGARAVRPALVADGFRDVIDHPRSIALRLPNPHCAFYSMDQFDRDVARVVSGYADRHRWLRECLADSVLSYKLGPSVDGAHDLRLESAGRTAQRWRSLVVDTDAEQVRLFRDRDRDGALGSGDELLASASVVDGVARFDLDETLLPGLAKGAAPQGSRHLLGAFTLRPVPLRYSYFLQAQSGSIHGLELGATNAITDEAVRPRPVDQFRATEPGVSYHPWNLPQAPAASVNRIGPGVVDIAQTAVIEQHTTVILAPGTTLRMAAGASLFFRGKVLAEGTADAPIRVESASSEPWGVFALRGQATAGSRFTHCHWRGGSTATLDMVPRTGMVSVIDTSDIVMRRCVIGENFDADDALHWGYVTGGEIRECEFTNARSDACDLDICEDLRLVDCRFRASGNDCLDLMTSIVEVIGCTFVDSGDKGISVGEGTRLKLSRSRFERCEIAIEVKDDSVAEVDAETVLIDCGVGVHAYRKNLRYTRGGTVIAERLQILRCRTEVSADKRSTLRIGEIVTPSSED